MEGDPYFEKMEEDPLVLQYSIRPKNEDENLPQNLIQTILDHCAYMYVSQFVNNGPDNTV